jgi:formylglycine-generating enzyme required for sulfatase activity
MLLQRFKHQVLKLAPDKPVPVHAILYPRFWKSPAGVKKKKMFQGDEVPWEEHPVVGISLYEALAYTTWLTQRTGVKATLPNEAQFERAAGWPGEAEPDGSPVELDPGKKFLFPWESQEKTEFHDFNYYFGQQGQDMENYFFKHQKDYNELLENTAKVHPDGNKIYMTLGWGWQWTVDRYAEEELKYSRFDPRNYPLCRDRQYRDVAADKDATVFKYRPNANIESSYFVVRGAPDVIGGPGTTTRRFALNPLRGYRNVGFRFVFETT